MSFSHAFLLPLFKSCVNPHIRDFPLYRLIDMKRTWSRKPNLLNPKCPDCGSITHKLGFTVTRSGKKQRFQCTECGKVFHGEK